jgi:hypothetical protein
MAGQYYSTWFSGSSDNVYTSFGFPAFRIKIWNDSTVASTAYVNLASSIAVATTGPSFPLKAGENIEIVVTQYSAGAGRTNVATVYATGSTASPIRILAYR